MGDTPQSKGGVARRKSLSAEERSEIARRAADSRWGILQATHTGELRIGDMALPCAVLEDGSRVVSEHGITMALLGSRSGASKRRKAAQEADGPPTPLFLASSALTPFIDKELRDGPLMPVTYRINDRKVTGYGADLLPAVCDIWLKARDAGLLQAQQMDRAKKAEIVMRALAHVGIAALVDEATGYQDIREREALQAILDAYLAKELAAWAKRFPDDFYKEMFRLRKWPYRPASTARPQIVAHYTKDLVYSRLAPELLRELETRNPKNSKGHRSARHHQWLTEDVGHPALAQHLHAVITLMKASDTWDQFKRLLDRSLSRKTRLDDLPLFSAISEQQG